MFTCFARGAWASAIILTGLASASVYPAEETPIDVRLLIDVSGSMKQNDPNNLRQPAVGLLVELLPENSKAGVWTFGKWVNMLIPHKPVDEVWRAGAKSEAENIKSVGLFTNIGGALEKAAYDLDYTDARQEKHLILLTDGMVDIDRDPSRNTTEWRRIVDELLPKFREKGFVLHTVGLSDNADKDLLQRLSLGTDGVASIAQNPEDLTKIFLKAFDAAVPSEQVPITDDGFTVDSSVEEFTASLFRPNPSDEVTIFTPDQQKWTMDTLDSDLRWHRTDQYDLITVTRPLEGSWGVIGELEPQSRVTVVSNLNMVVKPLPNNASLGSELNLAVFLQEDGSTIRNPDFLSLMDVSAELLGNNNDRGLISLWTGSPPQVKEDEGYYQSALPALEKEGNYELRVTVDGKTFTRSYVHKFVVRKAFGAEVRQSFTEGVLNYILTISAFKTDVNHAKTQVVASITAPSGQKTVRQLKLSDADNWQTVILPSEEGSYSATIDIKGFSEDGEAYTYKLDDVNFVYSAEGGMVEADKEPFVGDPTPPTSPAPEDETAIEEVIETEVDQELEDDEGIASWIIYAAIALANILLFGIGFLLIRKILGSGKKDDGDTVEEEKAAESQEETSTAEEPLAADDSNEDSSTEIDTEEEPPMEDLDASDDSVEDESEVEFLDVGSESEQESSAENQNAEVPNAASEQDVVEQVVADGVAPSEADAEAVFDDDSNESAAEQTDSSVDASELDEIFAEQDQDAASSDITGEDDGAEGESEIQDDDMVEAMLKAQGLDLAEDELDDAISSLIDNLEEDDSEESVG